MRQLFVVGSSSVTTNGRAEVVRIVWWASAVLLAVLLLLMAPVPVVQAQTIPNEYRLKAAFVYQFPQFVEWRQVFRGDDSGQWRTVGIHVVPCAISIPDD